LRRIPKSFTQESFHATSAIVRKEVVVSVSFRSNSSARSTAFNHISTVEWLGNLLPRIRHQLIEVDFQSLRQWCLTRTQVSSWSETVHRTKEGSSWLRIWTTTRILTCSIRRTQA